MSIEQIKGWNTSYFVYAMLCRDGNGPGYVKFGLSGNIGGRLSALRTTCPIPARYFAISEIGGNKKQARRVEKALHERFKDRKSSGEWFRFDFDRETDKREFNDGSLHAFQSILGGKFNWWTKISVAALDAEAERAKAAFMNNACRQRLIQNEKRKRMGRAAQKELSQYGV